MRSFQATKAALDDIGSANEPAYATPESFEIEPVETDGHSSGTNDGPPKLLSNDKRAAQNQDVQDEPYQSQNPNVSRFI